VNESDFPTIIGPDAKFKGQLSFEKGVKVLGSFEGEITTEGSLVIASGGKIQADIEAGSIDVEGEVHGNMAATDLIELKQTARLQGDIRCERLTVVEGAAFVGHCEVGNGAVSKPTEPGTPPSQTPPAPPSAPQTDGNAQPDTT